MSDIRPDTLFPLMILIALIVSPIYVVVLKAYEAGHGTAVIWITLLGTFCIGCFCGYRWRPHRSDGGGA